MTCEIDINTSQVWWIGNNLARGRSINYDTLWSSINRLDSSLNSLRSFNNSSGSVLAHVDRAQQNLARCKSECIEPTTNAMSHMASFLQSAAVQYENTEASVCAIFDKYFAAPDGGGAGDWFANLISAAAQGITDSFERVADFIPSCVDGIVNNWDSISNVLEKVLDFVAAAGIVAFAMSNPVGWVVLGAFAIATAYKYATGGNSIVGDSLALGAELAGADKETIENFRTGGKFLQSVGELFLPGGGVAKAAGFAGKSLGAGEKVSKLSKTLREGNKFTEVVRGSKEPMATMLRNAALDRSAAKAMRGVEASKTADRVSSYCSGLIAKENPVDSIVRRVNERTSLNISKQANKTMNTIYEGVDDVKNSVDSSATIYDTVTGERRKPEEERGSTNALSDIWHRCFN